jgi:hypothetical protein
MQTEKRLTLSQLFIASRTVLKTSLHIKASFVEFHALSAHGEIRRTRKTGRPRTKPDKERVLVQAVGTEGVLGLPENPGYLEETPCPSDRAIHSASASIPKW